MRQYTLRCLKAIKGELRRFVDAHKNEHGYKGQAQAYQSLLSWLENQSLQQVLTWFDVYQDTSVQTKAAQHLCSEPILQRDQLLLAFMGVADFPKGYKELPSWEWLKRW